MFVIDSELSLICLFKPICREKRDVLKMEFVAFFWLFDAAKDMYGMNKTFNAHLNMYGKKSRQDIVFR